MIKGEITLRPRYGEVDQMGYVYHGNYVNYFHQARTELMRELGIEDSKLEAQQVMMPVISMNLQYHRPAGYDELLTIHTIIAEEPITRLNFQFEARNEQNQLVCSADSTVVFVDSKTRKPMRIPEFVKEKFDQLFAVKMA
ncbi:acyl-CoA thioesterase [Mangrovibacterium diazotrophicum]|uniref:Acyl-CoA thioester hydrolase n=1 Tax=Mangrovibacterium diazotrophicum TaxID=1261403 RepID=A0A419W377_9BACT|nr:thioesterase family protein [Mangrovibacterium diazotrophicum]RKD89941.1 acyl-CoA thioester hydrolase [Mangrovibacterium diazotrophicum]